MQRLMGRFSPLSLVLCILNRFRLFGNQLLQIVYLWLTFLKWLSIWMLQFIQLERLSGSVVLDAEWANEVVEKARYPTFRKVTRDGTT